jgi:hypothetical protein
MEEQAEKYGSGAGLFASWLAALFLLGIGFDCSFPTGHYIRDVTHDGIPDSVVTYRVLPNDVYRGYVKKDGTVGYITHWRDVPVPPKP